MAKSSADNFNDFYEKHIYILDEEERLSYIKKYLSKNGIHESSLSFQWLINSAVQNKHQKIYDYLIQTYPKEKFDDRIVLSKAITFGNMNIVKIGLLWNGMSIDGNMNYSIRNSAVAGNLDMVKFLLQDSDEWRQYSSSLNDTDKKRVDFILKSVDLFDFNGYVIEHTIKSEKTEMNDYIIERLFKLNDENNIDFEDVLKKCIEAGRFDILEKLYVGKYFDDVIPNLNVKIGEKNCKNYIKSLDIIDNDIFKYKIIKNLKNLKDIHETYNIDLNI
jgi:hypothetical protein